MTSFAAEGPERPGVNPSETEAPGSPDGPSGSVSESRSGAAAADRRQRDEEVVLRPLATRTELTACVTLQKAVWGEEFGDVTSPSLLKIVQEVGGVAAGAFSTADDRLEGFVFGVSGLRKGRPAHWSHMLAVRPETRSRGLGARLKRYQRERLLEVGIDTVFWTYDPLMARNAHLNLARLGAGIERYVRDYYGSGDDSALSAGIGTDRMVVRWELASERVKKALAGQRPVLPAEPFQTPVVNVARGLDGTVEPVDDTARIEPSAWAEAAAVRVEIPADILAVREESPELARTWRRASRHALEAALDRGFRVATFLRSTPGASWAGGSEPARCWYLLVREES